MVKWGQCASPHQGWEFSAAGVLALLLLAVVGRLTRNLPLTAVVGVPAYGSLHEWLG